MGYDVRITRADHRADNEDSPIPARDWLRVVREDPELELRPESGKYFAE